MRRHAFTVCDRAVQNENQPKALHVPAVWAGTWLKVVVDCVAERAVEGWWAFATGAVGRRLGCVLFCFVLTVLNDEGDVTPAWQASLVLARLTWQLQHKCPKSRPSASTETTKQLKRQKTRQEKSCTKHYELKLVRTTKEVPGYLNDFKQTQRHWHIHKKRDKLVGDL